MTFPAITASIPTHNRPEMMRRAVQSVLDQDYEGPIEVIVVFDACEPVLPDVQVPPNRTLLALTNQRTRGLAGSRNTGILAASHEYVAFLDDDDTWLPDKLTVQIELMDQHPQTVLVGSAMVVDDGERTHERLLPTDTVTHADLIENRLAGLHSSSFLFRTEILRGTLGLVDEQLPASYGEDYDLLLRTAKLSPIKLVNRPLVNVQWQGQSYFFGKWAIYASALEYLLSKHPEFAVNQRALSRIESQIAFSLAASGQRQRAKTVGLSAVRGNRTNIKAYLALAIALRLLTAPQVTRVAQRFGKGI